jgi:hypothetical protein
MSRFIALLVALILTAAVSTVYAQKAGGSGDVTFKKKTVYDFDDDVVEGDLVRPDGDFVNVRGGARYGTLIAIRRDFIPEMLKSAEDI